MDKIEVKNRNILVTGGASGIGLELVKALAPLNNVYVLDRDASVLQKLNSELHLNIVPITADLRDWEETRSKLESSLPPVVHGLVNNAGVGATGTLLDVKEDSLDTIIAVNTRAIVNVSQVVAKRWIDSGNEGFCSIVNISSLASRFPTRISLGYNLSKAAVDMLTKSMALELGPHNIRVNSVNPGIVMGTDLTKAWVGAAGQALKEKLMMRTPLNRTVEKQDVVNAVVFLLWGDGVRMIHGDSMVVDGGYCVA